jgi:transposase InsO family protein
MRGHDTQQARMFSDLSSEEREGAGDRRVAQLETLYARAVAESFFSSLKKERIKKRIYRTRDMATAEIYDYIEMFYNRTRRHSYLSGVSPEAFEAVSQRA